MTDCSLVLDILSLTTFDPLSAVPPLPSPFLYSPYMGTCTSAEGFDPAGFIFYFHLIKFLSWQRAKCEHANKKGQYESTRAPPLNVQKVPKGHSSKRFGRENTLCIKSAFSGAQQTEVPDYPFFSVPLLQDPLVGRSKSKGIYRLYFFQKPTAFFCALSDSSR